MYKHRIETEELDVQLASPVEGNTGLQVVFGTAPINMAEDPYAVTNTPVLVRTFGEAKKLLGYSDDFKNYTLCQSMDASFRLFAVAPIVFVNILDPKKHQKAYSNTSLAVVDKVATISDEGILVDKLAVTAGSTTLDMGIDYIVEFNEKGGLEITLLSTDKTKSVTSLKVTGNKLDPSVITKEDIIGGYDVSTGAETGLEVLRQVYPKHGLTPGLILAPEWSKHAEVAAVMTSKTESVNGVFTCEAVIDIDTDTTKVYTGLKAAKEAMGINSKHAILLWPKLRANGKIYAYSAVWAAMAAHTDASNNDVPVKSPSNELLNVSAAVLESGAEVMIDTVMAEDINSNGIVTAMNDGGWRAWGNNTAAYPGTTNTRDRWISCRRMMSWYRNRFILAYRRKVSDSANYRLIEAVVDSENVYLNSLSSTGDIAGGSIRFNEDENPVEAILAGQIVFDTEIAFWTPAEYIKNRIKFDPTILQNALGGA